MYSALAVNGAGRPYEALQEQNIDLEYVCAFWNAFACVYMDCVRGEGNILNMTFGTNNMEFQSAEVGRGMYVYTYVCMYACMHACMYVCM